ncbi:MAG: polymerase [Candidatus Binatota bacterium]|nr:polymerase [Candidatus Binatota bacterium]
MAGRTILHADMDAFYAAVEQHDRPELRGQPVIVGGTGGRGVVMTASYEARAFGVRSAMPTVEARRLCPQAVFLPGRMARYAEVSRTIREAFGEFTPAVEPLSLDEAFLDVTSSLSLFGTGRAIAERLKARVREETGLTVSVGIGPTKMVAKIASQLGKPDGLLEVPPEEVDRFLRPLPVGWLWGVGSVTGASLRALGIETIADLADADASLLRAHLGNQGPALRELARGHDRRSVEGDWRRKSYGEENTFAGDLTDGDEIRGTIVAHAEAVARRLRGDGRRGRTITLKIKLARRLGPGKFPMLTRSFTLPRGTDDGKAIADVALALWEAVSAGKTIRLIGVSVSGIDPRDDAASQLDLFAATPGGKRAALNRAMDRVAERFGDGALRRGDGQAERASPTGAIKDRRPPP